RNQQHASPGGERQECYAADRIAASRRQLHLLRGLRIGNRERDARIVSSNKECGPDDRDRRQQQPARCTNRCRLRQYRRRRLAGDRGAHALTSRGAYSRMVWRSIHSRTRASLLVPASIASAAPSGPRAGTAAIEVAITISSEAKSATKLALGRSIAKRP